MSPPRTLFQKGWSPTHLCVGTKKASEWLSSRATGRWPLQGVDSITPRPAHPCLVTPIQIALNKTGEWANEWQMSFNETKCKVLHVGRTNVDNEYELNGVKLSSTDSEKDIGVIIHKTLKPQEQVAKAVTTANSILGQMSRAVHYRDPKTWTKLYIMYIRPHLEYATPAWRPWTARDIDKIENVQKRALNQITTLGHLSYEEKMERLGLTTLEYRRERADMIQVWKIVHKYDDSDESTWFSRASENTSRITRSTDVPLNLKEQNFRCEVRRNFFSVRTVKPWNTIPSEIREINSLRLFINKFDEWKTAA